MRRALLGLPLLLAACAHQSTPPAAAPETRSYTVVMAGHTAGSETLAIDGPKRTVDFEFNDRGRGPKTHTTLITDGRSITQSLSTTGNDYLKTGVTETFRDGAWSNGSESGASPDANAFFVSMYGPPEETAVLARALLHAPNGTLPLLPDGEASIRRLGELTVTANARSQHVTAYDITGLGFSPVPIWLDDRNELFASASSWMSVVVDGWEPVLPQLIGFQDEAHNARAAAVAAQLIHRPAGGGVAITGARLFDPTTRQLRPATTIVIRGNRIEAVGPDGGIAIPAGFEQIDATGRTVLPGLWDMHVHVGDDDGALNIANGVTTVRDLGNDIDSLLDLKQRFDGGKAVGPRIVLAGIVDGPGRYAGPTKMLVDTEEQARAAIDTYASHGYVQLKIYSSIKPALVPFMARYAHEKGMRVSGHVPAGMRAEDAVRDGFDELQHVNFFFLNFMPDVAGATNTPVRFTAVAQRAALIDIHSAEVRSFIDLLRERRTVIDPTVTVFETMFTARRGTMAPGYATIAKRLPPQVRRGFLTGGLPVPEGMDARYRESFANMLAAVKLLHDSGVPIVAGTDGLAGFTLDRELELYVTAGIPAPDVLRIATLGAATVMHRDHDLGSVDQGKLADLVIVDGDPTSNISDVRRVVTVIKDGNVYDAKAVAASIGVR